MADLAVLLGAGVLIYIAAAALLAWVDRSR